MYFMGGHNILKLKQMLKLNKKNIEIEKKSFIHPFKLSFAFYIYIFFFTFKIVI